MSRIHETTDNKGSQAAMRKAVSTACMFSERERERERERETERERERESVCVCVLCPSGNHGNAWPADQRRQPGQDSRLLGSGCGGLNRHVTVLTPQSSKCMSYSHSMQWLRPRGAEKKPIRTCVDEARRLSGLQTTPFTVLKKSL